MNLTKMDIQIMAAKLSDQIEIDDFLCKTQLSVPYQRLQWLLAMEKAYGHDYEYLLARRNSKIAGVLPVSIFKNLSGKKQLCSLPFCDVGGVVTDDEEVRKKLIKYAMERADQLQARPLELRQRRLEDNPEVDMTNRKVSMLLELPDSAGDLLAGFKSKLRSQIKKAEKNGLLFDFANDKKCIDDFFYVFSRNMHTLGSPTHSAKWFQALRETYQDDLLVGRIWFEGSVVAAGVLLFCGNNVSIPWASTLREHNRLAPNMLLYWNLLRVSCDRGCSRFDFGRSTYGEGTYNFKKQWGAKAVLLDWQYLDNNSEMVEMNAGKSRGRDVVETVWKNLPLPLANIIGPRLRKHISL